jgi:hypothetical protein
MLWKKGATTIVLDHVTKNPDTRGMFAAGHHRKIGGTDVHLGFEASKLERGGTAVTRITAHKDRPGYHRRGKGNAGTVEFRSDPTTHALTWQRTTVAEATSAATEWRPTMYMERVSIYVEQHGPVSRSRIYRDVPGKRERIVEATGHLLAEGYLDDIGEKLQSARQFRDTVPDGSQVGSRTKFPDDNAGSLVPKPFPAVPKSASTPGSLGSPSYREGNGNRELGAGGAEVAPEPRARAREAAPDEAVGAGVQGPSDASEAARLQGLLRGPDKEAA